MAEVGLFGTGLLLLALAGAYFGYSAWAARNLDGLVAPAPDPGETLNRPGRAAGAQSLHPGAFLPARQWADPRGTVRVEGLPDPDGFTPVSAQGRPGIAGAIGRADRIAIPLLKVDAPVEELGIEGLGSSAAYETPAFTVGHIPVTPNPGSRGNGWYFGHLESPVQNEGNVFARLPQVPDLLKQGEDVHVLLTTGQHEYLYRVTGTDMVHESDLRLYSSEAAHITLVTCYPRLTYDHRLLVTAELTGFRDAQ